MTYRILATARAFCAGDGPHLRLLEERGCEVDPQAGKAPLDAESLSAIIAGYDGAILGLDICDARVLSKAARLRVISRYGVGVDTVDVEAATRHGIPVTITRGANSTTVAELALGLILALVRQLPQVSQDAKRGSWRRELGIELAGRTLGIIGCGAIGREVASRARAFDMHILAYDPYLRAIPEGVEVSELEILLARADIVTLHAPLTPETTNLISEERLAQMKSGAYLVNTARGGLVDEQALHQALVSGRLAGAAMDAFHREPPEGNPLLELDNFLATPHIGSSTHEAIARMSLLAARNLVSVLTGEACPNVINPDYRLHQER